MTEHKHVFIEAGGLTYCDCGASPYTLSSKTDLAAVRELLSGDIEGQRLPLIEFIDRQQAHIARLRAENARLSAALERIAHEHCDYETDVCIHRYVQIIGGIRCGKCGDQIPAVPAENGNGGI